MKKLIQAHIERTILFDSELEFQHYLEKLTCKYEIVDKDKTKDGLKVRIRTQYNKVSM